MLLIFWETKADSGLKKAIKTAFDKIYVDIATEFGKKSLVKVIFSDGKKIQELNKNYRKKDKETDVLSFAELDLSQDFPALKEEESLGEIYLNANWVVKEKDPVKYASKLFIHGFLHLLGYDHETDRGEMEALENKFKKILL